MISSLANFLTLTLYRGGFPGRISWILMMFTLGVVGIARIAIERDRAYSLGYAGILGLVTFVSMLRFVDSPLFVVLILGLIAYLADIIVRDCTLIDETVDASGEGLIDAGRLFVKKQIELNPSSDSGDDGDGTGKKRVKPHQPGRTVLYLALAALPLFGLGQFFLRNDADTWHRAQRLLAFYLFASLSLLVTTSLLGLRRYLRQRNVDMPVDVSIAWLFGGLVMIASVLLVAYMAPMPGRALATFELPIQLNSPGNTQASRFGWGREGADKANPNAPRTVDPSEGKEEAGQTYQKGAPQGDVGEGSRQQGPTGNQSGGKQQGSPSSQPSEQIGRAILVEAIVTRTSHHKASRHKASRHKESRHKENRKASHRKEGNHRKASHRRKNRPETNRPKTHPIQTGSNAQFRIVKRKPNLRPRRMVIKPTTRTRRTQVPMKSPTGPKRRTNHENADRQHAEHDSIRKQVTVYEHIAVDLQPNPDDHRNDQVPGIPCTGGGCHDLPVGQPRVDSAVVGIAAVTGKGSRGGIHRTSS